MPASCVVIAVPGNVAAAIIPNPWWPMFALPSKQLVVVATLAAVIIPAACSRNAVTTVTLGAAGPLEQLNGIVTKQGIELATDEINASPDWSGQRHLEILFADEVVRARKAAAGHAAHAPKTRLELEHFLMEKGFGPLSRKQAIDLLSETGVVNDETAAERIVRSRRRNGGFGPLRLEAELRHRGVAPSIAGRQVSEQLEGADLAAECLELARKSRHRYEPLDTQAQRAKLAAFLMRRGYPGEHVWKAVRHLLAETGIDVGDDDTPIGDE
jgi:regulatory protein